jgi:hypothetical protein
VQCLLGARKLLEPGGDHFGSGGPRRQGVDPDSGRSVLGGGRLREPDHGMLGSNVGCRDGGGDEAAGAAGVDDGAGAGFEHGGQFGSHAVEDPAHVDVHDLVVEVIGQLVDRNAAGAEASVVECAVDPAEPLDGAGHRGVDLFGLRDVDGDRLDLTAGCLQLLGEGDEPVLTAGRQDHRGAFPDEHAGRRGTDPAARTGDQDGLLPSMFRRADWVCTAAC